MRLELRIYHTNWPRNSPGMLRDYFSASYIIPFDPWMGDIRITAFLVLDTCNPILYRAGMLDLTASGSLPAVRKVRYIGSGEKLQ